jgi:hypothetical protein
MSLTQVMVVVWLVVWLCACGGGGESGGSPGNFGELSVSTTVVDEPNTEQGFATMEVAADFDWQMQHRAQSTMQLVSNFDERYGGDFTSIHRTGKNANGLELSGNHLVKIYGIDQDNNVITTAIYTGMTDPFGAIPIDFIIPAHWLGLLIHVEYEQQTCSESMLISEVEALITVGCDVSVSSDL